MFGLNVQRANRGTHIRPDTGETRPLKIYSGLQLRSLRSLKADASACDAYSNKTCAPVRYPVSPSPYPIQPSDQRPKLSHSAEALEERNSMFKFAKYHEKAVEYGDLAITSTGPDQKRDFQQLGRRFARLADKERWLADNYQDTLTDTELDRSNGISLASEEEQVLRCLGAALIMQWSTLPTKLRREIFDNAGCMGDLLETAALRGKIARFLHRNKDEEDKAGGC
jgi:hypothetical protein